MLFAEYERCHYARPPLIEVVCQLRFPAILSIGAQDESGAYYYASLNDSGTIQLLSNSAVEAFTALTEETLTAAPEADGESGS